MVLSGTVRLLMTRIRKLRKVKSRIRSLREEQIAAQYYLDCIVNQMKQRDAE